MKSNKKQVQKGYCINFTNCPLADSGDIQEIPIGEDFKCACCSAELVEYKKPKKNWVWLCLGVVVFIAIVLLFMHKCISNPVYIDNVDTIYNECGDTVFLKGVDTIEVRKNSRVDTIFNEKRDTILIQGCDTIEIKPYVDILETPEEDEGRVILDDVVPVRPLPYGTYIGPRNSSGEPHGKGGRVVVDVEYNWGYYRFVPGDVIENTTYEYGQLKHGLVVSKDGTSYSI